MDFLTLAQERYSCRQLSDKPIEKEKTEKILEAARLAPTAVDRQPFHIWMTEDPETIAKIKTTTHFTFNAPLIFIVGADQSTAWTRKYDQRNFADVDAAIAATHMMMEIHDLGLGTTWVGHFNAPELVRIFPQCAGYDLIAIFPVGYPEKEAEPAQKHFQRKDLSELAEKL